MSIREPTEALNLDLRQQKAFVSYFNKLPQKPSSTVRFFNHTDFYTVHGSDTTLASEFTGNIIKQMGESPNKLAYLVLRKTQFEKYIRDLLLVRQYRVEVYIKTSGKIDEWTQEYKGSPGNLTQFEDILFDNVAITFNNYVMAVKIAGHKTAVACVNATEMKFQVCQLHDNECFTELEALIAQVGPKECIIPQGDSTDLRDLHRILERNGILVAKVKAGDFSNKNDVFQDLDRLLYFHEGQQRNSASYLETQLEDAMGSLNAVIKFLNLTVDERNFNQFKLNTFDIYRYVRLDNAALYSLNILPKLKSSSDCGLLQNSRKGFSLRDILDACVTSQGRRLLEQWIKQPLKDLNLINERLDIVQCFVKDPEARELLRKNNLTRLPDLLVLSKRLASKRATLQDCYKVYQVVSAVPGLLNVLKETGNSFVKTALVNPISEIREDLDRYVQMIEEVLDLDLVDRGEFFIKRSFSEELLDIYERKEKVEERMQKLLRVAAKDLGFEEGKTVKLECNDQYGYFFRVTLKEDVVLRKNSKYEILDAIKGGVRFTNEKLLRLNQDYKEVRSEYEEQQKSAIQDIFEIAAGYSASLRNLNMNIATVDVLLTFATVSVNARIPYVRPKLHEAGSGIFKLDKVRHPCLEERSHMSFVPNSIEFGGEDGKTFHIITGPNMCGKSTFIRSIGVCVLMAQIGCMVPCQSAEISLVDAILSRVGANDCELRGLSTFMLEMIETSTILKSATKNSLVIIDELGRGTSTYDGCGIAFSIAEYLAKEVSCFSLFATHFHEITRLAEMYSTVSNLHVTAVTTDDTITPLYQVRSGECDNSYGIHCAKMVNFPDDVIEAARNYQKELEHTVGTQFIKEYGPGLKRQIIKDGNEIIAEALQKVKSLDIENLTEEQLAAEVQKIKSECENGGNLFVKGLLSK